MPFFYALKVVSLVHGSFLLYDRGGCTVARPDMDNLLATALLAGWIVVHAAFPQVLNNYPERIDNSVAGYVAVDDCGMMGRHLVLVRRGVPDVTLAVADCANPAHLAYRQAMGYVADVDANPNVWRGPWVPQWAELWTVPAREQFWRRMERIA